MNYRQALRYLESFIDYEKLISYSYTKAFGLEGIKSFLKLLGNPQDDLRCIHTAGTKGKGSTCAFIAYILREAGFKAGLYTSPHLSDFRERIRILHKGQGTDFEGMISKRDLARLTEKIKKLRCRDAKFCVSTLTFFEIYTALAFLYFKEKNVDFAIIETGMGGRLDATNTVNPLVCVITPISLEHTQFLGKTLCQIAREKAGIIKVSGKGAWHQPDNNFPKRCLAPFPIVITAPQEKEVLRVIKNRCKRVNAKLYQPKINKSLRPRLLGEHQLINATVAKAAVEALKPFGIKIKSEVIKRGIHNTAWPGRCEVASRNPLIVLDGAQNVASIAVLKRAVRDNFRYKRLILIFGVSSDKDIKGMAFKLEGFYDEVILTKSASPRAANPRDLAGYFRDKCVHLTNNIKDAKKKAESLAQKEDLILVTGSLYVVGEARNIF